jgi:hypothetical protein
MTRKLLPAERASRRDRTEGLERRGPPPRNAKPIFAGSGGDAAQPVPGGWFPASCFALRRDGRAAGRASAVGCGGCLRGGVAKCSGAQRRMRTERSSEHVRDEGARSAPFGERKRAAPEGTAHRVRTSERAPRRGPVVRWECCRRAAAARWVALFRAAPAWSKGEEAREQVGCLRHSACCGGRPGGGKP